MARRLLSSTALLVGTLALGCGLEQGGELSTQSGGSGGSNDKPDSGKSSGGSFPTGGSGGSGGTSATGGAPGSENCENDKDDDGDGKIDCADSDCSDHECVPPAPSGWTGPTAFYLGAGPAPDCATAVGYPAEKKSGGTLVFQPASCPICSCGNGNLGCTATVQTYAVKACSGGPVATHPYGASGCQEFSANTQNSFSITYGPPSGNCASSAAGTKSLPPPTFDPAGRLCGDAKTGAGCSNGICAPKLPPGFGALCVYRDADVSCPPDYPNKQTLATGFDDKRDCAACACKPTCAFLAQGHSDSDCGDSVWSTVNSDGGCGDIDDQGLCGVAVAMTPQCTPAAGGPIGTVTPKIATVCCL